MSLTSKITQLAEQTGKILKIHKGNIGDLTQLSTTEKSSLVLALNELKGLISAINIKDIINDTTASNNKTYSSVKIDQLIAKAIFELRDGVDESSDTFRELAEQITALVQADNGLISAVKAQTFTDEQKAIARANIGASSEADLNAFKTEVGDTDHDFVAVLNTTYSS